MFDRLLNRSLELFPKIVIVLIIGLAVLQGLGPQITFNDIGWHLTQGLWKFEHLRFLYNNWFNYPTFGQPLVDEYPLYQALLAGAWKLGGEYALSVLAAFCFAGISWMLLIYSLPAMRVRTLPLIYALSLALTFFLALPRLILRPEIATFVGCAFTMLFLLRHCEALNWKSFWPLYLAQIAWTNCHSGFILGPLLTGAFGIEMVLRESIASRRIAWQTVKHWVAVSLLMILACLVNPSGWHRLILPFFHQTNFAIQAYVTEMQPWEWNYGNPFCIAFMVSVQLMAFVLLYRRRAAWSFFLIAAAIGALTFASQRQLAVFAFLMPGAMASVYAFSQAPGEMQSRSSSQKWRLFYSIGWMILIILIIPISTSTLRVDFIGGLQAKWRAVRLHHTEYPISATHWLLEQKLPGRLFQRSEIGGWLQLNGFSGRTYSDTGFGKYSPEFIHEIGLSCNQPHWLPVLLKKYDPQIVIASISSYEWPQVLREQGWRPVFYAHDGSVWVNSHNHDPKFVRLPTVTNTQIEQIFRHTIEHDGIPQRYNFYARWLLTLQSFGLEDFALRLAIESSEEFKTSSLFWEMAELMLRAHIGSWQKKLWQKLDQLAEQYAPVSELYRARALALRGKTTEAIKILENQVPLELSNSYQLVLLGSLYVQTEKWEQALKLLQQSHLFDLNDADRYQLLARCYRQANDTAREREAARLAHYFAPDQY